MGASNNYACSFLNVGATNTSYVLLPAATRPQDAPACCIIGRPFHAPPPTFAAAMPVKWSQFVGEDVIDFNAVYDSEAGIFACVCAKAGVGGAGGGRRRAAAGEACACSWPLGIFPRACLLCCWQVRIRWHGRAGRRGESLAAQL
jgi:hypothetical protein